MDFYKINDITASSKNIYILLFVLGITTNSASAFAAEGCDSVLQFAGRDFDYEQYTNTLASKIYNQECSESTSKQNSGGSLDVGVFIKSFPGRLGASGSSLSEKISNFCKTYDSLLKNNSESIKISNKVVSDSVNAWIACKKLASDGVDFLTTIQTKQFTIDVIRTKPEVSVKVTQVQYDQDLASCSIADNEKRKIKSVNSEMYLDYELSEKNPRVTISCKRNATQQISGETIYHPLGIIVSTTRGPFSLSVSGDATMPITLASTFKKELDKRIDSLSKIANDSDVRLNKVVSGSPSCNFSIGFIQKGAVNPESTDFNCPRGFYLHTIQFQHNWGKDTTPHEAVKITCCPISGD